MDFLLAIIHNIAMHRSSAQSRLDPLYYLQYKFLRIAKLTGS